MILVSLKNFFLIYGALKAYQLKSQNFATAVAEDTIIFHKFTKFQRLKNT